MFVQAPCNIHLHAGSSYQPGWQVTCKQALFFFQVTATGSWAERWMTWIRSNPPRDWLKPEYLGVYSVIPKRSMCSQERHVPGPDWTEQKLFLCFVIPIIRKLSRIQESKAAEPEEVAVSFPPLSLPFLFACTFPISLASETSAATQQCSCRLWWLEFTSCRNRISWNTIFFLLPRKCQDK